MSAAQSEQVPEDFTAPRIRELLTSKILRRERPPTEQACEEIGRSLFKMKKSYDLITKPNNEVSASRAEFICMMQPVADAMNTMKKALHQVHNAIPNFKSAIETMMLAYPVWAQHIHRKELEDGLGQLTSACDRFEKTFLMSDLKIPSYSPNWHNDAIALAAIFKIAMRSVSPEKEYGASAEGPLIRFVQVGLNIVRGAKAPPTAEAIKKALARTGTNHLDS